MCLFGVYLGGVLVVSSCARTSLEYYPSSSCSLTLMALVWSDVYPQPPRVLIVMVPEILDPSRRCLRAGPRRRLH
eukprot:7946688-Pyramimonas_sp.AAC.1